MSVLIPVSITSTRATQVLDFEHHVLPTMTGTRDKHYSAAGSHEHDEQWTEHITSVASP